MVLSGVEHAGRRRRAPRPRAARTPPTPGRAARTSRRTRVVARSLRRRRAARSPPAPCARPSGWPRRRRTTRDVEVLERREHEAGAEDEPEDEREQAAAELGELDRLLGPLARPWRRRPARRRTPRRTGCRRPRTRRGTPGGPGPASRGVASRAASSHGGGRRRAGAHRRSAMPAPTTMPTASCPRAPNPASSWWPTTPSTVAAEAMQNVTTGVAMPSLSPLSTFSTRRTRAGGARRRSPMRSARRRSAPGGGDQAGQGERQLGNSSTASAVPARMRQRQADPEQPGGQRQVAAGRGQRDRRRVGEQQQRRA